MVRCLVLFPLHPYHVTAQVYLLILNIFIICLLGKERLFTYGRLKASQDLTSLMKLNSAVELSSTGLHFPSDRFLASWLLHQLTLFSHLFYGLYPSVPWGS